MNAIQTIDAKRIQDTGTTTPAVRFDVQSFGWIIDVIVGKNSFVRMIKRKKYCTCIT
jgi:hypothetical protein